jgi:iron complex transport system substrate-binding protein
MFPRSLTRHRPPRPIPRAAIPLVLLALAACGSSKTAAGTTASLAPSTMAAPAPTTPPAPTTAAAPAFPVTVKPANGSVTIAKQPSAIVSLSPTATEMLFAIGAGPQVKAVDDQSNYPATAPKTALSGFTPNVEAIAAQAPDLVVVSNDEKGLVAALTKLSIPTLLLPAAAGLSDTYDEMTLLGTATGHDAEATNAIAELKSRIAAIVAKAGQHPNVKVYHELDQTYYSASSTTFIGQAYKLLGLTDIADAADTAATAGYPQLTAEAIVNADPQLIVLADTKCCQQSKATVAARPGWANIAAVQSGAIIEADDDVASRWGPRFADFLDQIATAVTALSKVSG